MSRYPPRYAAHTELEQKRLQEGHAQRHSHVQGKSDHAELIRRTIKRSGLTQLALAQRLGISPRSLTRFLSGDQLPVVVLAALEGMILLLYLQDLINSTRPGDMVPIGRLTVLHPALTRAEPKRPPAKPVKPKKVRVIKPKPVARKRRGIGMGRVDPAAEARRREELAAIHPWHRSIAALSLRQRATIALGDQARAIIDDAIENGIDVDEPMDDAPPKIRTHLL